ncbi:MAG TPA: Hsp20/alpha crystallin family protein [Chthoniobacterales bacterium]
MNTLVRENRSSNRDRQATEQFIAPAATVLENTDGYMLEVEMPGVSKENLEMWVENNELTILGRRSMPSVEGTLIHRESRSENFRRSFEIDPSIDAGKISAKIEQGVVTLTLPKAEQVKPRKIAVA